MFKALIGDLFTSRAQTLVNTVNCVGVMGKGVALEFKKRFPVLFDDYVHRCERKVVRLGEPYLYVDPAGARVVNFPTKGHWRSSSRLSDIERGLDHLVAHIGGWGITSIALPPLGCGNGGLEWAEVGPLIYRKVHTLPIDVEVYAPYGTPIGQLTTEFLASPAQSSLDGEGRAGARLNANWVALMEVLRDLQAQPYASPVGRTIFQKVCYVLTAMGVPTGFQFKKASYGPFSGDVKAALNTLANRNWLNEVQLGRMLALRVGPEYEKDRKRFAGEIREHQKKVDKTVDLFSRIKSTEQAEEVVTVLFASREIKQGKTGREVSEQDIFDYVLGWKKSWKTEEKRRGLAETIRNLVVLGWMRASISESMLDAA